VPDFRYSTSTGTTYHGTRKSTVYPARIGGPCSVKLSLVAKSFGVCESKQKHRRLHSFKVFRFSFKTFRKGKLTLFLRGWATIVLNFLSGIDVTFSKCFSSPFVSSPSPLHRCSPFLSFSSKRFSSLRRCWRPIMITQ